MITTLRIYLARHGYPNRESVRTVAAVASFIAQLIGLFILWHFRHAR